ncbi:MAG: putative quorum-sensing-regulated virulence factor, partial [Thermotogota bacterium]
MPFGKYSGWKMANVPASYLKWCWDNHIVSVRKFP